MYIYKLRQTHLDALEQWETKWQMTLRPDKCKTLQFTRKKYPIQFTYTSKDSDLPRHLNKYTICIIYR